MTPRALLLDVDGTLVDSMYLHITTWGRAFSEAGATVAQREIHRRIGMDGATIISDVLEIAGVPHSEQAKVGDRAKELHGRYYAEVSDQLHVLPGARELVQGAKERGWVVVLATSAPPAEFDNARQLLDVDQWVDAVTNGEDVDHAKPDPTIVDIAVQRAGVSTDQAIMVGDSAWDAVAAGKIGVRSIAVRTGGIGDKELSDAGYQHIVDDAAAVLQLLDQQDPLAN